MENKFPSNRRILLLVLAAALIVYAVFNLNSVGGFAHKGISLLRPFVIGAAIAFVLNVPLRWLEKKVFRRITNPRFKKFERAIAVVLSLLLVILIVVIVISLVVPQLIESSTLLINNVPSYIENLQAFLEKLPDNSGIIDYISSWLNGFDSASMQDAIAFFFGGADGGSSSTSTNVSGWGALIQSISTKAFGAVSSVVSMLVSLVVAFVFAIYILLAKERLAVQARKITFAFLPENAARYLVHAFQVAFAKFYNFITGQLTEAVILGTLCTIGMLILRLPYAVMIGTLTGFCALIPIVGALIGGVVGTLLIVVASPVKAVTFIIFLVILQQVEGHVVYPFVVGGSVGLPSMWTLFAITIGGSLAGLVGMLTFVPLMAALYFLFAELVHGRLRNKSISEYDPIIQYGIDEETRI